MLLRRFLLPLLLSLTVAAGLTTSIVAPSHATGPAANPTVIVGKKSQPPVKVARVSGFGRILVTARGFALHNITPPVPPLIRYRDLKLAIGQFRGQGLDYYGFGKH